MNYEAFVADQLLSDAAERCLSRISEAASKLGQTAEDLPPGHDWQAIRGIGNVLRHDYDRVALPRIWDAIEKNIRPLLEDVEAAVAAYNAAEN